MKVLMAEDDPVSRLLLERTLARAGYEPVVAADGEQAWRKLEQDPSIRLAVIDWMMPIVDGAELCRRIRERTDRGYVYVVMLTARGLPDERVAALESGLDDYMTKPYEPAELRSRLRVGERILALEGAYRHKVEQLEEALAQVKVLRGLIPICMFCKSIRNDENTWQRIEEYVSQHSEAMFSHSICTDCLEREYPELAERPSSTQGGA